MRVVVLSERGRRSRRGFTLVELLVVIGVIAMLMSLLMPALNRARQNAYSTKCKAQMRTIGELLLIYSHENNGWLYPVGQFVKKGEGNPPATHNHYKTLGYEWNEKNDAGEVDHGKSRRWPIFVFEEKVWNPPIMTCPSDDGPVEEHTYILNKHLCDREDKLVKFGTIIPNRSTSDVLLMGEKRFDKHDYYMGRKEEEPVNSEFLIVEPYKHGLKLGSNYLYLDRSVRLEPPEEVSGGKDPWDINLGNNETTTPPTAGTGGSGGGQASAGQ